QPRLQEAGGGLRAPGDSVTLSCRGSNFIFRYYEIWWYRQAPGDSLEWVSLISSPAGSTEEYGAAVKGRAKISQDISQDNSRSEVHLSLRSLQVQDSARYFYSTRCPSSLAWAPSPCEEVFLSDVQSQPLVIFFVCAQ
uniref:Ig-like domain-containing protein n=1 Tax=Cyanistes caeruleus TaxID=156563 RepID=A0A8C0UAS0_CYACU